MKGLTDIIESLEQAVSSEGLDLERERLPVRSDDDVAVEVDLDLGSGAGVGVEGVAVCLREDDRKHTVLERVVAIEQDGKDGMISAD